MAKNNKVEFTGVNARILKWKSATTGALKNMVSMLTTEGKGELLNKLRGYVNHDADGTIWSISWKFPVQGIFIIKGVGRGYVIEDGKIMRAVRKNNALHVIGGTIERHPQDWFNPVIEQRIPELANMISNFYADEAVDAVGPQDRRVRRISGINKTWEL